MTTFTFKNFSESSVQKKDSVKTHSQPFVDRQVTQSRLLKQPVPAAVAEITAIIVINTISIVKVRVGKKRVKFKILTSDKMAQKIEKEE